MRGIVIAALLIPLLLAYPALSVGQEEATKATPAAPQTDTEQELVIERAQTSLIQNAFIAAPLSGVVASVDVTEGQAVSRATPLIRLRSELAEKELIAARAALEAANLESDNDVNLRFARRSLQVREHELRQSQLANETYAGSVSEMELREIRLNVDQAVLAIEQAQRDLMVAAATAAEKEAAVGIAETNLDRHTLRTTVAGLVTEIDIQPGEWVEAGKPLVRIISLDSLRVECFVDGTSHGRDLVGRNVRFIPKGLAAQDLTASGTVTFVSPELHPVTGQVRLWATIENPNSKLGAGLQGRLIISKK
ncbi:MAG: HlyD family efflux transporter periplasmic adaptor subunit [Planctomycetota bacterium]